MKLWSKIASVLLVAAGLNAGQTTTAPPGTTPSPPAGGSTYSNPYAPENQPKPVPKSNAPATPGATTTATPGAASTTTATQGAARQTSGAAPATTAPARKPGPAAAAGGPKPDASAANIDYEKYILGPNDIVQVTVFDEPHLPGTYVIGPDGMMSMPLLGEFRAIGMTLPALKAVIAEKLKAIMFEPEVNVQLLRNNSKQYTVMGEVARSGPFPLLRQTTILDAMAACGGFKDFANPKKIYLMRGSRKFLFNYNDVRQGKHLEQNIVIEDGDYIYVP